jgi:hypothetical protein
LVLISYLELPFILNILRRQPLNIARLINLDPLELSPLFWASPDRADYICELPNKATFSPDTLQLF